ncbi:hypothetical protein M569_04928, partial [Genlisea aurea]
MLPQFGAKVDSLSKASTIISRIGTDAHIYDDPEDVSIAPLLDSKFDSEICEALKRLLALIAQGFDVSNYFPHVVKNVASQSAEVKKLVYLYLLHYAEKRPNEILLSINCFQKDLGDPNPLVRAWALRTMAGIRLHVIAPLVLVAVGKCARDPSIYVRKCAAMALPKLHDLQIEEHATAIEEIIAILLSDNSPVVVGAAAASFASICPNNLSLIGRNYKRLCETLPDVEEWNQIVLIGILLRYAIAKHGLVQESMLMKHFYSSKEDLASHMEKLSVDTTPAILLDMAHVISRSYLEGPDKYLSPLGRLNTESFKVDESCVTSAKSNDDVQNLLRCTSMLLFSYNSAVVLAAAGVHWIMSPLEDLVKIVKPLLFLLRSSSYSKYVVLCNILAFVKVVPSLFSSHFEDFYISPSDSYQVKNLKLEILSTIATNQSITSIFKEFQDYIRDPDRRFAADSVTAIGLCAKRLPDVAITCLEQLLSLALIESSNVGARTSGADDIVLVQLIKSIRAITKQDPASHEMIIARLVRRLDSIQSAQARAMVIWMIGEYCNIGAFLPRMIPSVLKYLARCFILEAVETKLQILNACVKVLLRFKGESMNELKIVAGYVLELATCDLSYDVRGRARALKKINSNCLQLDHLDETEDQTELKEPTYFLARCIFGGQAKIPSEPIRHHFYLPGSLSQIVFHAAPGYVPLPVPCSLLDHGTVDSLSPQRGSESVEVRADRSQLDDSDKNSDFYQENVSDYSSQSSAINSRGSYGAYNSDSDERDSEIRHLSNRASASKSRNGSLEESTSHPFSADYGLMSKRALESWLNENPCSSQGSAEVVHAPRSLATFSIQNVGQLVKPKLYTLLDPGNGNALAVVYKFSSDVSSSSKDLVSLEVSFSNHSTEPVSNILITENESNHNPFSVDTSVVTSKESLSSACHDGVASLVPMDKIDTLAPGQTTSKILQVHFDHHLLPLKLMLRYDGGMLPVKFWPDIGYFVKPLPMDGEAFTDHESRLPGMFECIRRCTFTDHIGLLDDKDENSTKDNFRDVCEILAIKMLSNASLFLVSVDMPVAADLNDLTGLCLKFSGEMILVNSFPCLVTLTVKGACSEPLEVSLKMNCEDTIFALNLLNRIISVMAEPSV